MNKQKGLLAIGPFFSAIGGFLDMVPSIVWAGLVAALALTTCVERNMTKSEQNKHHATKTEYAQYKTGVETNARLASETARETEKLRRLAATGAQSVLLKENAATAVAAARAADARRVSDNSIDRLTKGSEGSGDPIALKRAEEIAATLGQLLKTCRRESDEDAAELEGLAGQVRSLILQYDSLLIRPPPATP